MSKFIHFQDHPPINIDLVFRIGKQELNIYGDDFKVIGTHYEIWFFTTELGDYTSWSFKSKGLRNQVYAKIKEIHSTEIKLR
ncbi:MAG: hypothetical protein WBA59_03680 [Moheibacter sp.]